MAIENIKISQLNNIGSNLSYSSELPIDDLSANPITTKKGNLQIIGNYILSQAGGSNFVQAAQATLAQSVTNAAQPNITSVGTLTSLDVSGNLNITVENLKIPGGFNGYVLQTDGTGNLSWTAQTGGGGGGGVPGGANTQVQFNDAGYFGGNAGFTFDKTSGALSSPMIDTTSVYNLNGVIIENADLSHGATAAVVVPANGNTTTPIQINNTYGNAIITTGADPGNTYVWTYQSNGSFIAPGNADFNGNVITLGPGASELAEGLNNPTIVISDTGDAFIQAAINNVSDIGSADWVAYGHHGNDAGGWTDMGFTSSFFNDPNYTITGPGDGYVFAQGYPVGQAPAIGGGNLVLATGNEGTTKDIIFATGGFASSNEFARIDNANNLFHLTRVGSAIKFQDGSVQNTAYTGTVGNVISNYDSKVDVTAPNGNIIIVTDGPQWTFDTTGNLTLPTAGLIQSTDANNYLYLPATANDQTQLWTTVTGGLGLFTNNAWITLDDGTNGKTGNVQILAGRNDTNQSWLFDSTGNLTLPGNTFGVKYANGTLVSLSGSNTFTSITMSNTPVGPSNVIQYGLGNFVAWNDGGWVLGEFNGTNYGTEGIRINPGIEGSADIYLPSDANAIDQALSVSNYQGNVTINTGLGHSWLFDKTGNLTAPGNISAGNFIGTFANGNSTISIPAANGNISLNAGGSTVELVITTTGANVTGTFNATGQVNFGTSPTTTGAFKYDPVANWFGIYNAPTSLYYGMSSILPAPAGTTTIGGYYSGLGIGGASNNTNTPIWGVLTSTQSGNGIGSTAFTVYDTNKVVTFNNTLDNGSGNANVGNIGAGSGVFTGNVSAANLVGALANGNSNVSIPSANGNVITNINGSALLTVYSGGIKVGGSGVLQSPGGASSITLNNNGANIPTANITTFANITGSGNALNVVNSANIGGNLSVTGNITTAIVKTTPVTFSLLPTAATAGAGARAFITDGNVNTFGSQVGGGGIYYIPVFSNGTNWYVG